ncbi:MAG: transposase [Idiomarina sp.]|nr:MAG: transposase [Idiomarina sp.]
MINFPLPYPEELIYSVIARHRVHSITTSPKNLLRDIFGDTKIIATRDLTGHLTQLAELYPPHFNILPSELLYKHTMFPIYALFIGEIRRLKLISQLSDGATNTAHLTSGFAASRITQPKYLRYCPECLRRQWETIGECYWRRDWQIFGIDVCPIHGRLLNSKVERNSSNRHAFEPATTLLHAVRTPENIDKKSINLHRSAISILNLPAYSVPEISQWGLCYYQLASDFGCNQGRHIKHELVADKISDYWGKKLLSDWGLAPSDSDTCWLKTIFRKHRKCFSYLEHLVVLHSFLGDTLNFKRIVNDTRSLKLKRYIHSLPKSEPLTKERMHMRSLWGKALVEYGVKKARQTGFAATYAWLYRNDRDWLLIQNKMFHKKRRNARCRVDWKKLDISLTRSLITIQRACEAHLNGARRSMNWFRNQLSKKTSLEKNHSKLKLCSQFFERYAESTEDYQIRRLTRTVRDSRIADVDINRWTLLRRSGLSEERLTGEARLFIDEVLKL